MSGLRKTGTAGGKGGKAPDDRGLLTEVLSGARSEKNSPHLIADDVLAFAVARLEEADATWLEAQLKDKRFGLDERMLVALQLRGPLRKPTLTALGAPPFIIG